ncbi:hypothetical protein [Methylorubrum populi]|uniref:hypothetical protein n=1 Tax=Methylorubrum populi TaxID=223967 RepID=UPI003F65570E
MVHGFLWPGLRSAAGATVGTATGCPFQGGRTPFLDPPHHRGGHVQGRRHGAAVENRAPHVRVDLDERTLPSRDVRRHLFDGTIAFASLVDVRARAPWRL